MDDDWGFARVGKITLLAGYTHVGDAKMLTPDHVSVTSQKCDSVDDCQHHGHLTISAGAL